MPSLSRFLIQLFVILLSSGVLLAETPHVRTTAGQSLSSRMQFVAGGGRRLQRCTRYDRIKEVADVGWAEPSIEARQCSSQESSFDVGKFQQVLEASCKKEFLDEKLYPIRDWLYNMNLSNGHALFLSIQEWPSSVKMDELGPDLLVQLGKCVSLAAGEATQARPAVKRQLQNSIEAAFETYAVVKSVVGWRENLQKAGSILGEVTSTVGKGAKLAHSASELGKILNDRLAKIAAPLWEFDSWQRHRIRISEVAIRAVANDCNFDTYNEGWMNNVIKRMQGFLNEYREDFVYVESWALCLYAKRQELMARATRRGPRSTSHGTQASQPEDVDLRSVEETLREAFSQLPEIDKAQCQIAEQITKLVKFRDEEIPKIREEEEQLKAEYRELSQEYFRLRRLRCSDTSYAKRAEEIYEQMVSLSNQRCAKAVVLPEKLREAAELSGENRKRLEDAIAQFEAGVAECKRSTAELGLAKLRMLSKRAAFECIFKDQLGGYEQRMNSLQADYSTFFSFMEKAPVEGDVYYSVSQNCTFDEAKGLIANFENGFSSLSFSNTSCADRHFLQLYQGRLAVLNGALENLLLNARQGNKQFIGELSAQVEKASTLLDGAAGAQRCQRLEEAVREAETAIAMRPDPTKNMDCEPPEAASLKDWAKEIITRAKTALGDSGAAESLLAQAHAQLANCEFAMVDQTLLEIRNQGFCSSDVFSKVQAIEKEKKDLQAEIAAIGQTVPVAKAELDQALNSCDSGGIAAAVKKVSIHGCVEKAAPRPLLAQIEEIREWRGAAPLIADAVQEMRSGLNSGEAGIPLCELSVIKRGINQTHSALTSLGDDGLRFACLSIVGTPERLAKLESDYARLKGIVDNLGAKLEVRVHLLDSAIALLSDKNVRRQYPDLQFVNYVNKEKANLSSTASQIKNDSVPPECHNKIIARIDNALARIRRINAQVARVPSVGEVPSKDGGSADIDAVIGDIIDEATGAASAAGENAARTSQNIGSRVGSTGQKAAGAAGGWTAPQGPSWTDFTTAVNAGRGAQGQGPAYDPAGKIIKGGGQWTRTPVGQSRGSGRSGQSGSGSSVTQGQRSANCNQCYANVEQFERQSVQQARQAGGNLDRSGMQRALAQMRERCRAVCNVAERTDWSGGGGNVSREQAQRCAQQCQGVVKNPQAHTECLTRCHGGRVR